MANDLPTWGLNFAVFTLLVSFFFGGETKSYSLENAWLHRDVTNLSEVSSFHGSVATPKSQDVHLKESFGVHESFLFPAFARLALRLINFKPKCFRCYLNFRWVVCVLLKFV